MSALQQEFSARSAENVNVDYSLRVDVLAADGIVVIGENAYVVQRLGAAD